MFTHLFKQQFVFLLVALQVLTPASAFANKASMVSSLLARNSGEYVSVVGTTIGSGKNARMLLSTLDDSGKITGSLGFERASAEALKKFKPSVLSQEIRTAQLAMIAKSEKEAAEAAERAWAAHVRRSRAQEIEKAKFIEEYKRKTSFKATMLSTVKRFPLEAFSFYLVIGAFQATNLVFNYAENPLALQQHNDTQKDPVGHFGFLSFMLASGASGYVLQRTIQKPALRPYIPYMGMSIGMIASNIVHEIGHFPGLVACVASLKMANASCDEAYKHWTEKYHVSDKLHEWAPGLMSLIASTAISGYLQDKGLTWAALQLGKAQVLKAVAFNVALYLAPAGGIAKASLSFAGHLTKLAAFVGIDLYITAPFFSLLYRNVRDGKHFDVLERQWVAHFLEQPHFNWSKMDGVRGQKTCLNRDGEPSHSTFYENKNCIPDLVSLLGQTRTHFVKWNEFNLEKALMAHQNWLSHITRITLQYGQSEAFYQNFVNEVYQNLYDGKVKSLQILARQLPLNGITPTNLSEELQGRYLNDINGVEAQQLETVKAASKVWRWAEVVAQRIKLDFKKEPIDLSFLAQERPGMFTNPQKVNELLEFEEIARALDLANKPLEEFMNRDLISIGKAIDKMNVLLTYWRYLSPAMVGLLRGLHKALGNPMPIWTPGLGYAILWENHEDQKNALKMTEYNRFNGPNSAAIHTPTFAENMMLQMVQGPNANDDLITGMFGYPTGFTPPRIALEESIAMEVPYAIHAKVDGGAKSTRIFFIPVTAGTGDSARKYRNIFEYLSSGNISREIISGVSSNPALNSSQNVRNNFSKWWETKIFPQYKNTWDRFEAKYIPIMQDILYGLTGEGAAWYDVLGGLNSDGDRAFNAGNISNRLGTSLQQEVKLYLLLLGQMTKDLFRTQYNMQVPQELRAIKIGDPENVPRAFDIGGGDDSFKPMFDAYLKNCHASKKYEPYHCFQRAQGYGLLYRTSLFAILGRTNFLDFSTYARKVSPEVGNEITPPPMYRNLAFQENLLRLLSELLGMSQEVKIDGDKIVSSILNKTVDDKIKEITQVLDAIQRFYLGVAQDSALVGPPNPEDMPAFQLTANQQEIIKVTLGNIKDAVSNYGNFLQAVNAVSYKENHDQDGRYVEQDKCKLAVERQGLRNPMQGVNNDCK